MNNRQEYEVYKKAQNRVKKERAFYKHLVTYVIINILIIIFKMELANQINSEEFNKFLPWNLVATPVIWGLILIGDGLWTFRERNGLGKLFKKTVFSKEWEQKKIKEFMHNE